MRPELTGRRQTAGCFILMEVQLLNATAPAANAQGFARFMVAVPLDHVVISMPSTAYGIAINTLGTDMRSSAFDRELCEEIRSTLEAITEHEELAPDMPTIVDLIDHLEKAVDHWPQFDAPGDEPVNVSGADMIMWFDFWRRHAKDLAQRARAAVAAGKEIGA